MGSEQQPVVPVEGKGELEPGFAVGQYRIEGRLGQGGMGVVYAARQPEIGARVAIKVLAAELSRDPRLVRRFVDEARAVNKIRHPNIIDIFAFGRLGDGRHYFVMEHLEGETLAARLARGPLPVSDARRLLGQICEALAAAHAEQIVHRDLKPENIWIAAPRHGQPYAKLLDFGIAKLIAAREAGGTTEAGLTIGTPHFMSPEQCRGGAVDHRTDVYAMGVLLYFMWTGHLPFEGSSLVAVLSQQITATPPAPSAHGPVPARLERLILRCLEKDPALRPQTAAALRDELEAALGEALPGETLPAARQLPAPAVTRETRGDAPLPPDAIPPRARRRWLLPAAVAAVVAAALLVAGARVSPRGHPAASPVAAAPPVAAGPAVARPMVPPTPTPRPATLAPPATKATPPATRRRIAPPSAEERGFLRENPFR